MRAHNRLLNQLRDIHIQTSYLKHAEGSAFVQFGDTHIICTATVNEGTPKFLKGTKQGWLTAEYGMLPRATQTRNFREAYQGKLSGRTHEIQRLIGRALRSTLNLKALGDKTIIVDCDVIQADGGTRTAAITGGCVALYECLRHLQHQNVIQKLPMTHFIASVSVGLLQGEALLDLDYAEDSQADTDLNVVMTESGQFVEIQGTAEKQTFSPQELNRMLELANHGIQQLLHIQKKSLGIE